MDAVNHALAGAAAGMVFGHPVIGAIFGVLPDIVAIGKRREVPSKLYDFTHSLLGIGLFGLVGTYLTGSLAPLVAIMSHLLLDLPTHGEEWAPPLLYPFDPHRFSMGEEWEWFNMSWGLGFLINFCWISSCFSYALAIGSL